MKKYLLFFLLGAIILSCEPVSPNVDPKGKDILFAQQVLRSSDSLNNKNTVYVPIYSAIYTKTAREKISLTATLSIRNTSIRDTMFLDGINYYNTEGDLIRSYLEEAIYVKPMQTLEYVIEEEDASGGTGANFIIFWDSKVYLEPMFQAVMISTSGQHGISFTTEGVAVRNRK